MTEGATVWLDINKSYHLYRSFGGSEPYLAETAILELCKPREGEAMLAVAYVDKVNLMLLKWGQVANLRSDSRREVGSARLSVDLGENLQGRQP